jgi:hypothetical protein
VQSISVSPPSCMYHHESNPSFSFASLSLYIHLTSLSLSLSLSIYIYVCIYVCNVLSISHTHTQLLSISLALSRTHICTQITILQWPTMFTQLLHTQIGSISNKSTKLVLLDHGHELVFAALTATLQALAAVLSDCFVTFFCLPVCESALL